MPRPSTTRSSTGIFARTSYETALLSETDSLYIELNSAAGIETREIVDGLNVDLDANGDVVGFDIDRASGKLDLSRVETIALPLATAAE